MAKYKPAIFQATVRPSWAGIISYISEQERAGILEALIKFPVPTNIKSAFWEDTIKPDLEAQYEEFTTVCAAKGRASKNYWEKVSTQLSTQNTDIKEPATTKTSAPNNKHLSETLQKMLKEYPIDIANNVEKVKEVVENNKHEFCTLDEYIKKYNKSIGEYFYWLAGKGEVFRIKHETQQQLIELGYPVEEEISKERRFYTYK